MRDVGGILGEIVARKKIDVTARLGATSIGDLHSKAESSSKSFKAALAAPGARFVMEVKKSSPSEGLLRDGCSPVEMALAYSGAADAISVLTDTPYFGGSLSDLAAVRRVFSGPILAKDFVIDPRQVVEARLHGANAVLAIMSVLDDEEVREILTEAKRLNMDVLVETHDEDEVRRAVFLDAQLIGINNRNLTTLNTDLAVTERLAGLVPADRLLISESGIRTREDVARLAPLSDAFLVGSSLMSSPSPAAAARNLAFGRVKVCGLTNAGDAEMAAGIGATYAGIIMAKRSPRSVSLVQADAIASAASKGGLDVVAVVQNQEVELASEAARVLSARAVQLHGNEDSAYINKLRRLLPRETEIWGAVGIDATVPRNRPGVDRILYDSRVNGESGGTGAAFDWSRLKDRQELDSAVLAGGLNAGNAARAAKVGAFALDVSSGVECQPGRKDRDKLVSFFAALRLTARGEAQC